MVIIGYRWLCVGDGRLLLVSVCYCLLVFVIVGYRYVLLVVFVVLRYCWLLNGVVGYCLCYR